MFEFMYKQSVLLVKLIDFCLALISNEFVGLFKRNDFLFELVVFPHSDLVPLLKLLVLDKGNVVLDVKLIGLLVSLEQLLVFDFEKLILLEHLGLDLIVLFLVLSLG